ncbi:glycerol:H+ symporter-like protein [Eremomyces bilateralis CBS 781.70]|uniref:Glycerol:H+ symporter-like protein n=1 Tax=Eremomyces bilateralis CBS 781.70 TaxID=1392243 RepID=A0A6G1FZ88_9PEZI|nr:glycerol:H+ symporter-like protein [Eremomyces bilateralis CBS 781.70]KAF1811167.1 glycerol:H+ symporter-like protein [Eremomyces bilateralis CBS 781.70]
MSLLAFFARLYTLETLDTRFVVPSTNPPNTDARLQPQPSGSRQKAKSRFHDEAQPSKWKSTEFYFYYFIVSTAVLLMFWSVIDVSRESHPSFSRYAPLLSKGWIPGRRVDNSDGQFSSFRDNLPYLFLVAILHPLLRKVYELFWRLDSYTAPPPNVNRSHSQLSQGLSAQAAADTRLAYRARFDFAFAIAFIAALHGVSAIKVLIILYINYELGKNLPRKYIPAATWIFNIVILFANEFGRGYPLANVAAFIFPHKGAGMVDKGVPVENWGVLLDRYQGLIPRWEVLFKITVLRLISFNMDYYWSLNQRGGSPIEKKQLDPSSLSERDRVSIPAKPMDFNFRNYLAYTLYSPLYLAGPILTFNDYVSQLRYRAASVTRERTVLYAIRFFAALLAMELFIHFIYAVAIFKAKPDWSVYSPFQLSMLGFFNLHHIWLKLLLPWRFFRLWGLLDGIDAPENMVRCMSNNYSALAFWRGWHRSYNRWIVRYIYIPLGGSLTTGVWGKLHAAANFLMVFMFVAIWHDIQLRLLQWGWLVSFFVMPEVLASKLFPKHQWQSRPNAYRIICGIGAVGNIIMMMVANLVGFAIGLDGIKSLVHGIVGSWSGLLYVAAASGTLFVGAQIMFELREEELRHRIKMKC